MEAERKETEAMREKRQKRENDLRIQKMKYDKEVLSKAIEEECRLTQYTKILFEIQVMKNKLLEKY